MGRPEIALTDTQIAEVETLAAVLSTEQVADYFGISRTTFFAILRRDEDVAARYKRGKARAIGAVARTLISKARAGDTASMIFYLKTQGGWRETASLEHQHRVVDSQASEEAMAVFTRLLDDIAHEKSRFGAREAALEIATALPGEAGP